MSHGYVTVSMSPLTQTFVTGIMSGLSAAALSAFVGGYSLRVLVSSYVGPVAQISNGTTSVDAYADQNGTLWLSPTFTGQTLQTWLGASTGYIKKLYDQAGFNRHVTQATQSACPTVNFTSPPTMTFNSANSQFLGGGGLLAQTQAQYTFFAVWNTSSTALQNVMSENVANGGGNVANNRASIILWSSTGYGFCGESNDTSGFAPYTTNSRVNTVMRVTVGQNILIKSNGTDYSGAPTNSSTLNVSSAAFAIGYKLSVSVEYFNGTITHIAVFNVALTNADAAIIGGL